MFLFVRIAMALMMFWWLFVTTRGVWLFSLPYTILLHHILVDFYRFLFILGCFNGFLFILWCFYRFLLILWCSNGFWRRVAEFGCTSGSSSMLLNLPWLLNAASSSSSPSSSTTTSSLEKVNETIIWQSRCLQTVCACHQHHRPHFG